MQTEINLIRSNPSDKGLLSCHSVCTLLLNRNNIIILAQGPAVLAAGWGWKSCFFFFFFFFLHFLHFNLVLPGNETVSFWHLSDIYNVSFTK